MTEVEGTQLPQQPQELCHPSVLGLGNRGLCRHALGGKAYHLLTEVGAQIQSSPVPEADVYLMGQDLQVPVVETRCLAWQMLHPIPCS